MKVYAPPESVKPDHLADTYLVELKHGLIRSTSQVNIAKSLRKFYKFHFDVQDGDTHDEEYFEEILFHACRSFRTILKGKTLVVLFNTAERRSLLKRNPNVLDGCKILEHTSVRIKGVEIAPELKEQLRSRRTVQDTYKQWYVFQTSVINALPSIGDDYAFEEFQDRNLDRLDDLRTLATRYDTDAYLARYNDVLELAVEWKNRWWNDYIKQLEPGIESMRNGINIYKDMVGEDLLDAMNIEFHMDVLSQVD